MFWVATPDKAAEQIYNAIVKKKKYAYITKRWRLAAWLLRIIPDFIYNKF
jgi:short-subunit dehydrogenase